MMKQVGGAMIGGQTGAAVAELANEVTGSFDIGLPFVVLHTRLQFPRLSGGR